MSFLETSTETVEEDNLKRNGLNLRSKENKAVC